MHVAYANQLKQWTMQVAKEYEYQMGTQYCKREDEQNEFYFSDEDQPKEEMTQSEPEKLNSSPIDINTSKQHNLISGQQPNTYKNQPENRRYNHAKAQSEKQSLQSHLSKQLPPVKFEPRFNDQQAMRRAEKLLDQQLQEYISRNRRGASQSEKQQKPMCSTKTNKIKAETQIQVKAQPYKQSSQKQLLTYRSASSRKKRTFISQKIIQDAVEMFERRKSNPLINLENIAEKIDVGYTTICKLYKQWNRDRTLLGRKVHIEKQKVRKMEIDEVRIRVLEQVLYLNPYLQQNELVQEMNKFPEIKESGTVITRFIIYELLKNAGYVKKKGKKLPLQIFNQQLRQEKKKFCRIYKQIISQQHYKVLFLGEMLLNIYNTRAEGWCKQGEELVIRCPTIRSKSVSTLFFVFKNGSFISQVRVGALQTDEFNMAVANIIKDSQSKGETGQSYLIVDTTNLETEIDLDELEKYTHCQILKVPPNSPQLSIIEHFFSHLKSKLKFKKLNNQLQLKQQIQKLIKQDQSKRLANYFQRIDMHSTDILRH